MRRIAPQRGVALIIALLVVALATVLIAGLTDRGELVAARTRNALRTSQADAYARGLEQYAARLLLKDLDEGRSDFRDDIWSVPMPPQDVPGGTISATVRDLDGCFNVNNVWGSRHAAVWQQRFAALLKALRLDPTLLDVVVDWLDGDLEPGGISRGVGAEDAYYAGVTPAYKTANRLFEHVSELRLLQGVDARVYAALAPHVCALPRNSTLNINTATIPVLQSLDPDITEELARRLWNDGKATFKDVLELQQELQRANVGLGPEFHLGLVTYSDYFQVRGDVVLDGLEFHPVSVLTRFNGVRVLQRSRGSQ
ncbi:type II secretion system minor pseudopilin GspK [Tahibacter amnicola]|uniref:Type II secretion system protein K n=1 Tax=Tahibacter amnicola TaxID=2976241 RepID=A0ABY6BBZ1_9GAMM|nr:type II secretion system minor pseudopilin GspK [Tahibacter amnicola]UXI67564.1 type II secretion system minor pseudopilin GspK [Tahibacter amnicola]